jgi:hypothetical protein
VIDAQKMGDPPLAVVHLPVRLSRVPRDGGKERGERRREGREERHGR